MNVQVSKLEWSGTFGATEILEYKKIVEYFRNVENILYFLQSNESVDKFNWICGWIQKNSLINFDEFVIEFKSTCWWIQMNLLMNSNEFVNEF